MGFIEIGRLILFADTVCSWIETTGAYRPTSFGANPLLQGGDTPIGMCMALLRWESEISLQFSGDSFFNAGWKLFLYRKNFLRSLGSFNSGTVAPLNKHPGLDARLGWPPSARVARK